MFNLVRNRANLRLRFLVLLVEGATLLSIGSCSRKERPSAPQATARTFASPDDAGKGLFEAAKSGNPETVLGIFGPGAK
jgi:hypothetical protein